MSERWMFSYAAPLESRNGKYPNLLLVFLIDLLLLGQLLRLLTVKLIWRTLLKMHSLAISTTTAWHSDRDTSAHYILAPDLSGSVQALTIGIELHLHLVGLRRCAQLLLSRHCLGFLSD